MEKAKLPAGVLNNLRRRMSPGGDLYGTKITEPALRSQYPDVPSVASFRAAIETLHAEGLTSMPLASMGLVIGPQR